MTITKSRAKMTVSIRGTTYPNAAAAAEAVGVSVATVYSAVIRGTTDTVGLGHNGPNRGKGGLPPKPLTIGHISFPSMRAASIALGMSAPYISMVLCRGKERAKANLLARAMKYQTDLERKQRAKRLKEPT